MQDADNSYPHFNQLDAPQDERLALLAEECAEVIQIVSKIQRHGFESRHPSGGLTNRGLLEKEMGHLHCALALSAEAGDVSPERVILHLKEKTATVSRFLHHNRLD